MNDTQFSDVQHALMNGNRFYTDANDPGWNDLVQRDLATKHPGWDPESAYYRVTAAGEKLWHEINGLPF